MIIKDNRKNFVEFKSINMGEVCIYEGQVVMKMYPNSDSCVNAVYLGSGYTEYIHPDVMVGKVTAALIIE